MEIKQAVQILEQHNKWRKDNSFLPKPMTDPQTLRIAIDTIVAHFKSHNDKEPKGKLFCECKLPSMDMRGVCFKCDSEVDIDLKSHNDKEPPPTKGKVNVTDAVIVDIAERSKIGTEKYGTPLMTHNGRKPLVDAYQEILDMAVYIKQELLERSEQ